MENSIITQTLLNLGLNKNEVKIYLNLLQIGSASASALGQKSNITRSTAQYACQRLTSRGLFHKIEKNGTFIYSVEPPEKLLFLIDNQQETLKKKKQQVHQILGALKNIKNPNANLPNVRFYDGLDGVKKVLNDTLTSETELLTFSDVAGYISHLHDFNAYEYAPKRKELGIFERLIIPDTPEAKSYLKDYIALEETDYVFIDHDLFPFYSEVNIYDNKVSYVTFSRDGTNHVGLLIENKEIYETQKSIFEMIWKCSKGETIPKA